MYLYTKFEWQSYIFIGFFKNFFTLKFSACVDMRTLWNGNGWAAWSSLEVLSTIGAIDHPEGERSWEAKKDMILGERVFNVEPHISQSAIKKAATNYV